LVRAVGRAIKVNRENVETKKFRSDKSPMSVWVRVFAFVAIM
jgi:hypothetical protein